MTAWLRQRSQTSRPTSSSLKKRRRYWDLWRLVPNWSPKCSILCRVCNAMLFREQCMLSLMSVFLDLSTISCSGMNPMFFLGLYSGKGCGQGQITRPSSRRILRFTVVGTNRNLLRSRVRLWPTTWNISFQVLILVL